jgi:hypothetical protein
LSASSDHLAELVCEIAPVLNERRIFGSPERHSRDPMSERGLVSRVTPVHTAMRNCTRDEGRSFEFGNQVLISSHRKLLWSKATVVNVAEKSEQDFDRYD